MDNQNNNYSAFFKLYDGENLQVSFNIVGADLIPHLDNLEATLTALRSRGFTTDPKQAQEGERIQEATGWVLGKTSQDKYCIHLYGPEHLQWKFITVWEEQIEDLGISIKEMSKIQPILGSAPEREMAVKQKVLRPFNPPLRVVLVPQYNVDGTPRLSDRGNPVMRFSHIHGKGGNSNSNSTSQTSTTPVQGNLDDAAPPAEDPDVDFRADETVDTYPEVLKLLKKNSPAYKMVVWARKQQGSDTKVASSYRISNLEGVLDDIVNAPGGGLPIMSVLSGLDVDEIPDISESLVEKLISWLTEKGEDGELNTDYNLKYVKAIENISAEIDKLFEEEMP